MAYLASRPVGGGSVTFEKKVLETELEVSNHRSRGWGIGQAEAVEALEAREGTLAVAAAERAYTERGMSEKAREEAEAYDASVAEHVGEIPETPIRRKPGRPKKSE
jgi:hypothetical protein